MNEVTITQQQGMTSLQVSEATGKRHDGVLRDIRKLLDKGVSAHNFVETSYTDKSNRQSPMYTLTPKGCLILASGYDPVLREKIIDKLEELTVAENRRREVAMRERHDEGRPSASVQEVEASIKWIEFQRVSLGLGKSSTLGLIQKEGKRLGLPVVSSVAVSRLTYSATELLKMFPVDCKSTAKFNKALVECGFLEEKSRGTGKKRKAYKQLTQRGLKYGENRVLPNGNGVTWPVYFSDTFWDLLYVTGQVNDQFPY